MSDLYDLIVVGAGPSGASAAREARRLGLRKILVIERQAWPRAKTCGGGLSPRARKLLKENGLWDRVAPESYSIQGLRLVSPNGNEVLLKGADTASVLNRRRFDAILMQAACEAGAEFRPETQVGALLEENGRVAGVKTADAEIEARWVVAADGARACFGSDIRPRAYLHTMMGWYEGVPFTPNVLEMIYDMELGGHYGWLFPESERRVNIGICMEKTSLDGKSIRDVFERFLDKYYAARLAGAQQLGVWKGYPISYSVEVEHHAPPGLLLVGEAARLANPATGEGISYAMLSGQLAARHIAEGDRRGLDRPWVADQYAAAIRKATARNFKAAHFFRRHGTRPLNLITSFGSNRMAKNLAGETLAHL
ncbi:MAG: NAD(P)/FAD-dependent oxidoreductase [Myxococcales bacterium]|nr:MAG: NAD(P)/FAD-dependent oxidoreductase [Myxococcales bacterium]